LLSCGCRQTYTSLRHLKADLQKVKPQYLISVPRLWEALLSGFEDALAAMPASRQRLLGSALAYGLFFWFASQGDLTGFTALTFLTPVFALLSGLLFLEESLRPLQWLGALLALLSVLLIHQRQALWQGRWSNVSSEEMS